MPNTITETQLDYKDLAEATLKALRSERDRKIVSLRYGLGLPKRHTLERIGSDFGITRERVRQIEKAATVKLRQSGLDEVRHIDGVLHNSLSNKGHVARLHTLAEELGAKTPDQQAYIVFLATLAPNIEVIDDGDHYHAALSTLPEFSKKAIHDISSHMVKSLQDIKSPTKLDVLHAKLPVAIAAETAEQIAHISKRLSHLDGHWGLSHWPEVNPRSIRDKTYLILSRAQKPLHFSDIAKEITSFGSKKRDVTVQAVHNELIKDPRFVLVGRGIYALNEWGYSPGTVADIISDVLKDESPLHKDEIVKRVLEKRHVKTTTIVLNLQEKDQFVRVAKATYALK